MSSTSQESILKANMGGKIRISKRGHIYEGILKGNSYVVVLKPGLKGLTTLWLLENGPKELHFEADDGWDMVVSPSVV